MKKILIIVVLVIGVLVSVYGVTYGSAIDGITFSIEKLATSLNKVSDYILPNQFQPSYLDKSETWLTTEHSGVIPIEYITLLGYNEQTDILHENTYGIERTLVVGSLKSNRGEYIRLSRTINGETFSMYIGKDDGFTSFGYDCMAIGINGLYVYVYENRSDIYNNTPKFKFIGQVWSSELDYTLEDMIINDWID